MAEKHRRKKYLVDHKLQLRYTLMVLGVIVVVTILSMAGVYYTMWGSIIDEFSENETQENLEQIDRISGIQESRERAAGGHVIPRFLREANMLSTHQKQQLLNIMNRSQKNIIPKIILLVFFIGVAAIFITHRVAGPLFRVKRVLKEFNKGKSDIQFSLRKGDKITDIADELNKTFQKYQKLQGKYISLLAEIDVLSAVQEAQSADTHLKKLKDLHQEYLLEKL